MRKLLTRGLVLSLAITGSLLADTRFVVFGGGSSPQNDQLSLLSNVHYFDRVRALMGMDKAPCDVYFADGGKHKVVQATAPHDDRQASIDLLGMIMFNTNMVHTRFRAVDRENLAGASTAVNLEKWFDTTAKQIGPNDRLIFYFTGHGGGDHDTTTQPRNTTFFMWGSSEGYTMKRFVAQLDKIDPKAQTTLIMVQCYSGGFANVIYKDGDPANGFSDHPRAGFFSTISTRMAAGCTPEIDEDDYHEFSTAFFEGLTGESRTGAHVNKADYDHDGKVTFAEAFGYTVLHSPTIDIPFCTSDQLLRDKSRFHKDGDSDDVLPENAPWSKVIAAASPTEKVVLEELSKQLGVDGEDRLATAASQAVDLRRKIDASNRQGGQASQPATRPAGPRNGNGNGRNAVDPNDPRVRLRTAIFYRWPELSIPFDPDTITMLDTELPSIMAFVKSQPEYERLASSLDRRQSISSLRNSSEVKWVQYQRLLERAKSVILANNLSKVSDATTQKFYAQLIALENKTLD